METPHSWLGREFQELLSELRVQTKAVRIAVTRPSGRSYGEGALRAVQVREEEERWSLLFAYERYQTPKA